MIWTKPEMEKPKHGQDVLLVSGTDKKEYHYVAGIYNSDGEKVFIYETGKNTKLCHWDYWTPIHRPGGEI